MHDGARIYVAQGEQAIATRADQIISTILGSCVSVCLTDRERMVGGVNHILLPDQGTSTFSTMAAGAGAMERLINALTKVGARKRMMEAKVFGGAAVVAGLSDIGRRNSEFVFAFLAAEDIPCVARCVGGDRARRLLLRPATGEVRQKFVAQMPADEFVSRKVQTVSDIELF